MRRALALAIALVACGDDNVDLSGMYQVDTAVGSEPCGADTPTTMPPLFLKLSKEQFFGADYFSMEECMDAAGTDCSGGGLFGDSFSEPIDSGWRGVVTSSSSGGSTDPTCTLFYSDSSAVLKGTKLTVEASEHSEDVDNTEALCTTDEAEKRNDAMPCIRHEKIEATSL